MRFEPDEVLLRRYHTARDAGDLDLARRTWEQLAINNFDRIKQTVKAFRFSAGSRGLPELEWGSAASEAYLRVVAMGANFREREVGQFQAALVRCVQNACRDYGRKELRHQKKTAGSLDKKYDPDGEAGPYDAALAAYDAQRRAESADRVEGERKRERAERLVAWALGQIRNANHREVLEMTYGEKLSAEAIANRLGISMDNVYARRSRGIKELEKILRGVRS